MITKKLIRAKLDATAVINGTINKESHTVTILRDVDGLKDWLKGNRISYTDIVSFNKDRSEVHTVTVDFGQLQYINTL